MLRVGIDLDNTIINYQNSFNKILRYNQSVSNISNKKDLKSILKKKGEKNWLYFQENLYTKGLKYASIDRDFKKLVKFFNDHKITPEIISHKSKYSYLNKIELRSHAKKFLEKKLNQSELKYKIIFKETLDSKIKEINKKNFDFFIDDLKYVIKNKNISNNIVKILFGSKSRNNISFLSWHDIHFFFKDYLKVLIILKKNEILTSLKKISLLSNTNSKLYKIEYYDKSPKILKIYNKDDFRERAKREIEAYKFLSKKLNIHTPNLLFFDDRFHWIVIEYIHNVSLKDEKRLNFILKNIFEISNYKFIKYKYKAKDSFLSLSNLNKAIDQRFIIYKKMKFKNKNLIKMYRIDYIYKKLKTLVEKNRYNFIYNKNFISENLFLSFSDISFKNTIFQNNQIYMIDLEYFGIDDPTKMLSDLFWHPDLNKNSKLEKRINKFIVSFLKKYNKNDDYLLKRFDLFRLFYGFIWFFITINFHVNQKNFSNENKILLRALSILKKLEILIKNYERKLIL